MFNIVGRNGEPFWFGKKSNLNLSTYNPMSGPIKLGFVETENDQYYQDLE